MYFAGQQLALLRKNFVIPWRCLTVYIIFETWNIIGRKVWCTSKLLGKQRQRVPACSVGTAAEQRKLKRKIICDICMFCYTWLKNVHRTNIKTWQTSSEELPAVASIGDYQNQWVTWRYLVQHFPLEFFTTVSIGWLVRRPSLTRIVAAIWSTNAHRDTCQWVLFGCIPSSFFSGSARVQNGVILSASLKVCYIKPLKSPVRYW